jgi:hypothetical protein
MKITQNVSVLAALFSLCSVAALPAPPAKPFSLYAYGQNISGLPFFISGDVSYVGNPNSLPSSLNVSCESLFVPNIDLRWPLKDP